MRRRLLPLVIGIALSLPACGWIVGEITQQIHRQRALEDHVYQQELGQVWKEVRDLGNSHGCSLPEQPKLAETFACEQGEKRWLRVDARDGGHRVEIEVERTHTDAEGKSKTTRERDWELEWKLLERLDPDTAGAVESEAQARGDKAKKATRELGEALEP